VTQAEGPINWGFIPEEYQGAPIFLWLYNSTGENVYVGVTSEDASPTGRLVPNGEVGVYGPIQFSLLVDESIVISSNGEPFPLTFEYLISET